MCARIPVGRALTCGAFWCWRFFKQGLNCDYDRLTDYTNEHDTLRKIMGHGIMQHHYEPQTIVDNVSLLSPQLLAKVNQLLVQCGHEVVRKKAWRNLARAR